MAEASQGDPSGKRVAGKSPDRRSLHDSQPIEMKVARLNARASLRGTALALGGVIVGALISGYFTSRSDEKRIDADEQRAAAQFIKEQQKSVYTSFLSNHEVLRNYEEWLDEYVRNGTVADPPKTIGSSLPPAGLKRVQQLERDIPDTFDKLSNDVAQIDLVGSEEAKEAARDVRDDHFVLVSDVANGGPVAGKTKDDFESFRIFDGIPGPGHQSAIERFVAAARNDLGGR